MVLLQQYPQELLSVVPSKSADMRVSVLWVPSVSYSGIREPKVFYSGPGLDSTRGVTPGRCRPAAEL